MTMQEDRSLPGDTGTGSGGEARDPAATARRTDAARQDRDAPPAAKPELSEAIDRATASVGQDDGKR